MSEAIANDLGANKNVIVFITRYVFGLYFHNVYKKYIIQLSLLLWARVLFHVPWGE